MFLAIEDGLAFYVAENKRYWIWIHSLGLSFGSPVSFDAAIALRRSAEISNFQDCRDRQNRLWGMQQALGLAEDEIEKIDKAAIALLK